MTRRRKRGPGLDAGSSTDSGVVSDFRAVNKVNYEVHVQKRNGELVVLGPTDTRDEAAKLAEAWLESHAPLNGWNAIRHVGIIEVEEAQ